MLLGLLSYQEAHVYKVHQELRSNVQILLISILLNLYWHFYYNILNLFHHEVTQENYLQHP